MQNHFDVIVVGGGIAGNSCALSLAQCGLQIALLSHDSAPIPNQGYDARIYALSHNSVQLLKDLRVWDALRADRMCPIQHMSVMGDANSLHQGMLNFNAASADQSELAWIIEQSNIQSALLQAIQFSPNITMLKANATALNIDHKRVSVDTSNNQTISADLLIGSDGAHSWVQQAAHIDVDVFDYELDGVVANFACASPHHNTAQQWFLQDAHVLALLPLPNQHVSMVYSCSRDKSNEITTLDPSALSEHITELSQHALGSLTAHAPAQAFALKRRRAKRFIAQRLVLIGDAAHTVHPLAGQGLNLGLQDVSTLRQLISERESFRTIFDPILLRRYERHRSAATSQMQGLTHALNRLFQHPHPAVQHARNFGMNLLDAAPPLKCWLIKTAAAQPQQHS